VANEGAEKGDGKDEDGDDSSCRLVFFAVTDPAFAKHFTVGTLLKEFRSGFYELWADREYDVTTKSPALSKQTQPLLTTLMSKYGSSKLLDAQSRVEHVKDVMKVNVEKALGNVEHLEELEVKSEEMQAQANAFRKKASSLKWMFQCRYYKITCILVVIVGAIVGYIIYAIYHSVHG